MSTQIIPRSEIAIRPATMDDLPFLDRMQKANGKALGFFPLKQFEGYIETGGVMIAEEKRATDFTDDTDGKNVSVKSVANPSLGYCISRDRYLKRDELGVFFQLCIDPGARRKLVGAALVKATFERAAYGCKLYCCWCAQDLDANWFWESMGFVPIAFRAGAKGKRSGQARVHIFWQRRINAGDVTTPYWYPFRTGAGAIREDRLVFPIPPGTNWRDVMPVVLPTARVLPGRGETCLALGDTTRLSSSTSIVARTKKGRARMKARGPGPGRVAIIVSGRIKYIDRPGYVAPEETAGTAEPVPSTQRTPTRPAAKIDPKYLAGARELRDRYLEHLNGESFNDGRSLPAVKHDVGRALPLLATRATPPFGVVKGLPMAA